MHITCLIVDDEIELAKMTCEYFQMFDVSSAYVGDAQSCLSYLKENTIDILLLDINLQEENGFWLCKKLREEYDFPILFISARQSDDDVLVALNIGGDDYVKKPYALSVLLAKVKIIQKRMGKAKEAAADTTAQESGKLRLDEATLCAYVDGRQVSLKAKEYKLLACLFEHRGTIVKKERLFELVWGDSFFSDGTLNVHIRKLREKLEENPNEPKLIKTIWGTGYMLKTEEE